jgi:hypothetical protein
MARIENHKYSIEEAFRESLHHDLADRADHLAPAEALLDALSLALADLVADVPRGATIDGTAAGAVCVLRDMGRDLDLAARLDEATPCPRPPSSLPPRGDCAPQRLAGRHATLPTGQTGQQAVQVAFSIAMLARRRKGLDFSHYGKIHMRLRGIWARTNGWASDWASCCVCGQKIS